jgi:hypothetical protein
MRQVDAAAFASAGFHRSVGVGSNAIRVSAGLDGQPTPRDPSSPSPIPLSCFRHKLRASSL